MRPATWKPTRLSMRGRTSPDSSAATEVAAGATVITRTGRMSSVTGTGLEQAASRAVANTRTRRSGRSATAGRSRDRGMGITAEKAASN